MSINSVGKQVHSVIDRLESSEVPDALNKARIIRDQTEEFLSILGAYIETVNNTQFLRISDPELVKKEIAQREELGEMLTVFLPMIVSNNNDGAFALIYALKTALQGTVDWMNHAILDLSDNPVEIEAIKTIALSQEGITAGIPNDLDEATQEVPATPEVSN